jgi:7-cyano-7-deazaguanine reductase
MKVFNNDSKRLVTDRKMFKIKLKTLPNINSQNRFVCTHSFSELTALCPITKLPDFYTITIIYEPNDLLIELKSLKLYLGEYRDSEIIHEDITNVIFQDFIEIVKPRWVQIKMQANVRGGISTIITVSWSKKNGFEIGSNQRLDQ